MLVSTVVWIFDLSATRGQPGWQFRDSGPGDDGRTVVFDASNHSPDFLFECNVKSEEERVVHKELNLMETLIQRTTMEAPR